MQRRSEMTDQELLDIKTEIKKQNEIIKNTNWIAVTRRIGGIQI